MVHVKMSFPPPEENLNVPAELIDESNLFCGKIIAISGHPVLLARDTVSHYRDRFFCSIRISAEDHGRQPVAESVQCFGSWDGCDMMEAWRYDSVRMVHTTMSFM